MSWILVPCQICFANIFCERIFTGISAIGFGPRLGLCGCGAGSGVDRFGVAHCMWPRTPSLTGLVRIGNRENTGESPL